MEVFRERKRRTGQKSIHRQIVDSLGLKNDNTGAIAEALGHSEMKII